MINPTTKDGANPAMPPMMPKCPGCGKQIEGPDLQIAVYPVIQQGSPWWAVLFHNTCGAVIPFMFVPAGTGVQQPEAPLKKSGLIC